MPFPATQSELPFESNDAMFLYANTVPKLKLIEAEHYLAENLEMKAILIFRGA